MSTSSLSPADQVVQFLATRRELRGNPRLILDPAFRAKHGSIAFSVAESIQAGFLAQILTVPVSALFFDTPNLWDAAPAEAIGQLSNAFLIFLSPLVFAASNIFLAWLVSITTPRRVKVRFKQVKVFDIWLFLEGAYGFWGRFAFAMLIYVLGVYVTLGRLHGVNEGYLTAPDFGDLRNVAVAIVIWATPVVFFGLWAYNSIVDGTFDMVRTFTKVAYGDMPAFNQFLLIAKLLTFMLFARVVFFWLAIGFLLLPIGALFGFAAYEVGHWIRYELGLEAEGFVGLDLLDLIPMED